MAFNGMSWQQYSSNHHHGNKFAGGSGGPGQQGGRLVDSGAGDMQEMHLKMSKKIAQLTKVIYALNTKNDEHESAMGLLREAHEEEMQKLLATSTSKLQEVKFQLTNDSQLKRKVESLQQQVATLEEDRLRAEEEIEALRERSRGREQELERDHSREIGELAVELGRAKDDFERKIGEYERRLVRQEESNDQTRQVTELKRRLDSQELTFAKRLSGMEEERDRMRVGAEEKEEEARRCREECESKLEDARRLHAREVEVMRKQVEEVEREKKHVVDRELELKTELDKAESRHRKRVQELGNEVESSREEVEAVKAELDKCKRQAQHTGDASKSLHGELEALRSEHESLMERETFARNELEVAKMKIKSQQNDITQKSSIIGTLEAIKLTQDESIGDLEEQLGEARAELARLEGERSKLVQRHRSDDAHHLDQINDMATKLDKVQGELQWSRVELTRKVGELTQAHERQLATLREEHEGGLEEVRQRHRDAIADIKKQNAAEAERRRKELEQDHARSLEEVKREHASRLDEASRCERAEAGKRIDKLNEELDGLRSEVTARVQAQQEDASKLRAAAHRLEALQAAHDELGKEADEKKKKIDKLEGELESALRAGKELSTTNEERHIAALEKVKRDKDEEWEKIVRCKLSDLRSRLTLQHTAERRKEMEEGEREKNREMVAAKQGWQEQIRHLTTQMTEQRSAHRSERERLEARVSELKERESDAERERDAREREREREAEREREERSREFSLQLAGVEQRKEEEMKRREKEMGDKHREETHQQMMAHQVAMTSMKEMQLHEHQDDMKRREREFEAEMDELKTELMRRNMQQCDEVRTCWEEKMNSLRHQLDEERDQWKGRNKDNDNKIAELKAAVLEASQALDAAMKRSDDNDALISTLRKELESKVEEVLRARSDAKLEVKRREEELSRRFLDEHNNLEAERLRAKQVMVNEFNQATGLLKEKVADLKIKIHDLEDRYEKRESRPEDVEAIHMLQEALRERDLHIHKIMDDKKYIEMELVNRETNFNKVFNSSPNVGVLNPRLSKKKKQVNGGLTRGGGGTNSPTNTGNRLEPIRQPTPPHLPKKVVRTLSEQRLSRDFFSDEATSQLDSYDDVIGELRSSRVFYNHHHHASAQQRRRAESEKTGSVWRSELNLFVIGGGGEHVSGSSVESRESSVDPDSSTTTTAAAASVGKKQRGGWLFASLRKKK